MKDWLQGFEIFSNALLPTALAVAACIARQAHHGWQGVRVFVRELIICSFMGVVIFWGLDYADFPPTVDAAITSGGAFASLTIIDAVMDKLMDLIRNWHGRPDGRRPE